LTHNATFLADIYLLNHLWDAIALGINILDIGHFEELAHVLLLELIVLCLDALVEPVGILDAGDGVEAFLEGGGNRHDFLDG